MTSKCNRQSRRLVIDASVAHAAGNTSAVHHTSISCRDFLRNVLDICHRLVMTDEILKEWKRHMSSNSRRWLKSMYAHKKVIKRLDKPDAKLRNAISSSNEKDKDARLIEAAWETDKRIASLDEKARKLFSDLSGSDKRLRKVLWINPAKPEDKSLEWLADGAKLEKSLLLGNKTS